MCIAHIPGWYTYFGSRVPGSYLDIPQIPVLATTNEVTVSICIRGHSQRGPLLEWSKPPTSPWSTHFWIADPGSLYARPWSSSNLPGIPARADISSYDSWVHVGFTVCDDGNSTTTKLFVNGKMQESKVGDGSTLELTTNIRLGNNPENIEYWSK